MNEHNHYPLKQQIFSQMDVINLLTSVASQVMRGHASRLALFASYAFIRIPYFNALSLLHTISPSTVVSGGRRIGRHVCRKSLLTKTYEGLREIKRSGSARDIIVSREGCTKETLAPPSCTFSRCSQRQLQQRNLASSRVPASSYARILRVG